MSALFNLVLLIKAFIITVVRLSCLLNMETRPFEALGVTMRLLLKNSGCSDEDCLMFALCLADTSFRAVPMRMPECQSSALRLLTSAPHWSATPSTSLHTSTTG